MVERILLESNVKSLDEFFTEFEESDKINEELFKESNLLND